MLGVAFGVIPQIKFKFNRTIICIDILEISRSKIYICGGNVSGKIWIYALKNIKRVKILICSKYIRSIKFSLDGKFIISGHADGKIKVWSINEGKNIKILKGHKDLVY